MKKDTTKPLSLHAVCKLGLADKLREALQQGGNIDERDLNGKTPLHYAVQHEECLELLLEQQAAVTVDAQDNEGCTPLHHAVQGCLPMAAYMLATKGGAAVCLIKNCNGKTSVDLAVASERGEVLNALLLACSSQGGTDALAAMQQLLASGAVCDTWAPNGSSALMLAAAIDSTSGVKLLLANGATIELQDALGRTALMFAAGNDATASLSALLAAGASVSIRDRRGRNVMDYAVEGSVARTVLQEHLQQLESKATELQAALLAELLEDPKPTQHAQQQQQQQQKAKKAKKKKGSKAKKVEAALATTGAAAPSPSLATVGEEEEQYGEVEAGAKEALAPDSAAAAAAPMEQGEVGMGGSDDSPRNAGADLPGSGRSSLDGDVDSTCPLRSPSPPGSPGWCTVSTKPHSRQHSKPVPVPVQQQQQQQQQQRAAAGHHHSQQQQQRGPSKPGRFEVGGSLDSSAARGVRRCPSSGSLASTCSGESHDTDASSSKLSGSERSVLRPSRQVLIGHALAGKATGGVKANSDLGHWAAAAAAAARAASKSGQSLLPPTASWGSAAAAAETPSQPNTWAKVAKEGSGAQLAQATDGASGGGAHQLPSAPQAAAAATAAQGSAMASAPPAEQGAGIDEMAALREQVAALQRAAVEAELRHRLELSSVLEDAAKHELLAVQQAVSAERMNCIVRFTSFLQHSGSTLFASFPDVFGGSLVPPACHLMDSAAAMPLGSLGAEVASGPLHIPQQQQQQQRLGGSSSFASGSPFESFLATAANNGVGLAQSPPTTLDFSPLHGGSSSFSGAAASALSKPAATSQHSSGVGADRFGSLLLDSGSPLASSSPLSSTPFSYQDIEERLRGEYEGNQSAFVQPAAADSTPAPAAPLGTSLLTTSLSLSLGMGIGTGSEL